MITGRYWVRTSLGDTPWLLELRDGAQGVPISSRNWADHEVIIKHGVRTLVVVCCGPAAPLPDRWDGWYS